MLVTYLRSSSLGTFEMCPQKYYFSYVLGVKDKENGKAIMGSVVHKNLELLARYKLALQAKKKTFVDDNFGRIKNSQVSIEYFNELSHEYYETNFPGIMPKEAKTITLDWTIRALERLDGQMDPRNQNIFAVEEFFEVEIDKPWAKYSYELNGQKIEGQLGLKGTVDLIVHEDDVYFHIMDYKGLPIDTPIPTPLGWSTMCDLKIGDFVFDQYGNPTKVIAKSSVKTKDCYQITFDDTSVAICDNEHYWKLSDGSVVQIENLKVGDKINVPKPIDCGDDIDLPIDPYVLGIWLGDGRNRSGEICSGDKFIFEEIERRGYKVGKNLENRNSHCESRTIFGLTNQLRKSNLLHNKHIPSIYFRASYNQRLDLLRGLMDSDGSANKTRKQCIFMNCREILSDHVKDLLLTLGQRPLKSKTIAKGFGIQTTAFPISFRPIDINPFLLPAKSEKVSNWGYGRSSKRRVVKIEQVAPRETQCISVDSYDSTYLCTRNMIPTHNTGRRFNWATEEIKTYELLQEDKQLLLYYYALRLKYPEKRFYVSIYFINDHKIDGELVEGGLFTFVFDDTDFEKAEKMLRKKFEEIRDTNRPRLLSPTCSNWKCKSLCRYSQVIPEFSTEKPACLFIRDEIEKHGIDYVTSKYANAKALSTYTGGGRIDVELKEG